MLRAVIHVVSASVNSAALSFDLSRSDFHLIKDTEQNRGNKLLRIIILISSFLGVKNEQKWALGLSVLLFWLLIVRNLQEMIR